MIKKLLMLVLFSSLLIPSILMADDDDELEGRRGFTLGVGPTVGGEVHDIKQAAGGARFRIGWGFSERLLVFLDNAVFATRKDGYYYAVYNGQAKGQFFLYKDLYVNLGFGIGVGTVAENLTSGGGNTSTKTGFSTSGGIGYEFRPTKHFIIAPEITFDYDRLRSRSYVIPAGFLYLGWYL